jgi:hypothetical protein
VAQERLQAAAAAAAAAKGRSERLSTRARVIEGVGHIYVVHFEPLAARRAYLESIFFVKWRLAPGPQFFFLFFPLESAYLECVVHFDLDAVSCLTTGASCQVFNRFFNFFF